MTPAKRAKQLGAPSLKMVADTWGVTMQGISQMYYRTPDKFEIVVLGCIAKLSKVQLIMLIAKSVKKTKLHTVTHMYSDATGELYYHFNYHDGSKSYLIKASDLQVII